MKRFPLLPRPVSALSALLLYFFFGLYAAAVIALLPRLVEIGEESPRLAALGYLALWLAPIPGLGLVHHLVTLFLDKASGERALVPGLAALWAGVYGWFVMFFAVSVSALVQLVIFPPDSLTALARGFSWPYAAGGTLGVHTFLWVSVATMLYDLERSVRERL